MEIGNAVPSVLRGNVMPSERAAVTSSPGATPVGPCAGPANGEEPAGPCAGPANGEEPVGPCAGPANGEEPAGPCAGPANGEQPAGPCAGPANGEEPAGPCAGPADSEEGRMPPADEDGRLNELHRTPGLESWNSWWQETTGCCSGLTPRGRYRPGTRSWLLRLGLVLFWKAARRWSWDCSGVSGAVFSFLIRDLRRMEMTLSSLASSASDCC